MAKQNKEELSLNSPEIKNILFWIMMFVVICLCIYLIIKVNDGSVKCMANPIPYGISQLESSDNNTVTCSCSMRGSNQIILFNRHNGTLLNIN